MVNQLYEDLYGRFPEVNLHKGNIFDLIFDKENERTNIDDNNTKNDNMLDLATAWLEKMMASNDLVNIPWDIKEWPREKELSSNTHFLKSEFEKNKRSQLYLQIEDFVNRKVEKKFLAIEQSFNHYYRSIPEFNKKLQVNMSSTEAVLDEFLQKISPGFIAMDFRIIWMFAEIEADFNVLVKQFLLNNPSQIINKYLLNSTIFNKISEFLSKDLIIDLIPSLYNYSYQLKKVELYSKNIHQSLLGDFSKELVIACSSRFNHSYINYNYKFAIIEALKNSWDKLFGCYEASLEKLNENYRYVLINLYAGLFHRVSLDYDSFGMVFKSIHFEPVILEVHYDETMLYKTVDHLLDSISEIENVRASGETIKSMEYSERLYQIVELNKGIKNINISSNKSALYIAALHKYIDIANYLVETRNTSEEHFLVNFEELYRSLSLILKDTDIQNLKAPLQFDLTITYVYTILKRNEFSRLKTLFDYVEKMICRFEKGELYEGENIENDDYFYSFIVLLAKYAYEFSEMKHPFVSICKNSQLSNNIVNSVLQIYKQKGGVDSFYNHFQNSFAKKTVKKVKSLANILR